MKIIAEYDPLTGYLTDNKGEVFAYVEEKDLSRFDTPKKTDFGPVTQIEAIVQLAQVGYSAEQIVTLKNGGLI